MTFDEFIIELDYIALNFCNVATYEAQYDAAGELFGYMCIANDVDPTGYLYRVSKFVFDNANRIVKDNGKRGHNVSSRNSKRRARIIKATAEAVYFMQQMKRAREIMAQMYDDRIVDDED